MVETAVSSEMVKEQIRTRPWEGRETLWRLAFRIFPRRPVNQTEQFYFQHRSGKVQHGRNQASQGLQGLACPITITSLFTYYSKLSTLVSTGKVLQEESTSDRSSLTSEDPSSSLSMVFELTEGRSSPTGTVRVGLSERCKRPNSCLLLVQNVN